MHCLYRLQYKSKRVHVPKYTHCPTTGYARVLLFMFIRRELAEDVYFSLHTVDLKTPYFVFHFPELKISYKTSWHLKRGHVFLRVFLTFCC